MTAKNVLLARGELNMVVPGTAVDTVATVTGATTLSVLGAPSVKSVYGEAKVAIGSHLYVRQIDETSSSIATNRIYTHLLSFPTDLAAAKGTVNGVTFNTVGVDKYSFVNKPGSTMTSGSASTGFGSIFKDFMYNGTDYTIVLTGLTPHAAYDCRFYWMNYGVGSSGNGKRTGTFTFITSDNDTDRTIESYQFVLEETGKSSKGSAYNVIGCRYRAGADGVLKLRVKSGTSNDTVHLYALSNELVNDTPVANEATTIAPESGSRNTLRGTFAATSPVTIAGAGEQRLGGSVNTSVPLTVNGKLVLTKGANVETALNIASGGSVTMHGGTTVRSFTGAGEVKLAFGDKRPYGAVQADGTFAAADNFRIDTFTGDADSGLSPSKEYLLAFNYRANPSGDRYNNIVYVNEVPFMVAVPDGNVGSDITGSNLHAYYDVCTQARLCPIPTTAHAGSSSSAKYIGIPSSEAIYNVLYAMAYGGFNGSRTKMLLSGLTAGTTYELRFYERTWDATTADKRNVKFEFDPNGSGTPTVVQTVKIDNVGRSATGAYLPYTITFRFKAAASTMGIWVTSLDTSNTWHLYGMTLEKFDAAANVRTFNITSDQTFGGAVSGIGEVSKLGNGTLTLTGNVNAQGFWTINDGAVFLTDSAQTLGDVSVKAGTFGGTGSVAGDLGVSGTATLELDGAFNVGGTLAIGEGANVVLNGNAACVAKAVQLPAALTIKPASKLSKKLPLFTSDDGIGTPDTTGWVVYKEDGVTPDNSASFSVSSNGKSLMLNPSRPTVIMLR